jgi:putative ABC transport system permease protein
VPVSLAKGEAHYDTALRVLPANTTMHLFRSTGGEWLDLPGGGLLVGQGVRDLLDLREGEAVTITGPEFGTGIEVPVAGFVDEPLGTLVYASREAAEARLGTLPVTSALVRYEPGADPTDVRNALTGMVGVAAFEDAKAVYQTVRDFMVLFYGFVGIMLLFGGAMAFALIFNAMTVNISERSREVATLLAVGVRRRTISHLITGENLLVALAGIPVGLVVGHWVSALAMASFESDLFSFDLYIRPTTYLFAALAIVVVALISEWPGLRALRRIDIPRIVKERST